MKNAQKLNNSLISSNLNQSGSIFIDMDAKRKEVEQLLSDKREIERKIEEIRAKCKHEKTVIKQVADGSGSSTIFGMMLSLLVSELGNKLK
jgi:hypothetical protein